MPHIHIEMIGGLAGDMFLAAALAAGLVETQEMERCLSLVGLGQISIQAQAVRRYGIGATHVSFSGWDPKHEADHRHLTEIEDMLNASDLAPGVRDTAIALFRVLGEAESAIHQIPMDHVHFHEIGAVDSLLDFVAAAYIIHKAQATWSIDHVPAGQGVIQTEHGVVPATAPATARLLLGFEMEPRQVQAELVTPTGAAILKFLAPSTGSPAGRLMRDGYGAGTKDFKHMANVVRMTCYDDLGEQAIEGLEYDIETITRLSAEVDDQSPEALAYVSALLLERGALDVLRTPVYMKKGRLGTQLAVLCHNDQQRALAELVLTHTSTLGVRVEQLQRFVLPRTIKPVETELGFVQAKFVTQHGKLMRGAPEFDDCAALAQAKSLPVSYVLQVAQHAINALIAAQQAP